MTGCVPRRLDNCLTDIQISRSWPVTALQQALMARESDLVRETLDGYVSSVILGHIHICIHFIYIYYVHNCTYTYAYIYTTCIHIYIIYMSRDHHIHIRISRSSHDLCFPFHASLRRESYILQGFSVESCFSRRQTPQHRRIL